MNKFIKNIVKHQLKFILSEDATANQGDYGYHIGNLEKKSESLSRRNYIIGVRGALGTGYYFFGDINDAKKLLNTKSDLSKDKMGFQDNAKAFQVDFSKYHLFKPSNPVEYYDNLVIPVNNQVLRYLTPEDFKDKDTIDTLIDVADFYNEMGVNISAKNLVAIAKQFVIDLQNKSGNDDNFNTRVLKAVGFEGVDVRGTVLDDFTNRANVGSVIFDLKKDSIQPLKL